MREVMILTEYMGRKYEDRDDKDNIFGVGMTDAEFRAFAIDYLLGRKWYISAPISQDQVNEVALHDILTKYSKEYRKEHKKWQKQLSKKNSVNGTA